MLEKDSNENQCEYSAPRGIGTIGLILVASTGTKINMAHMKAYTRHYTCARTQYFGPKISDLYCCEHYP